MRRASRKLASHGETLQGKAVPTATNTQDIRNAFLAEASNAPSLFADLAKVELYIAESYRARALIELLQNADDAGATTVRIVEDEDRLIVANDGRVFTSADVESLCRSGASNKQRGSGSIGYRGIGFKSVAGLATEVIVLSGDHSFRYSKDKTRIALSLKSDVPLIRIPHPLDGSEIGELQPLKQRYAAIGGTVFILAGIDLRALTQEVEDLAPDVLIFLNNVSQIDIRLGSCQRLIQREITDVDGPNSVEYITEGETRSEWLVRRNDGCERIALQREGTSIVPMKQEVAVIHAFLPTQEFSGAFLKLNGDFSTDPSRKSVDLDALSESALKACSNLLWAMMEEAVTGHRHEGLFSILKSASSGNHRVAAMFRRLLVARLATDGLLLSSGKTPATAETMRLPPNWLNYADYEALCRGRWACVPSTLLAAHPALPDALKWLDAKTLTLTEALNCSADNPPSPKTCAQLWVRMAKQMRFDLTTEMQKWLASLPILPLKSGNVTPARYKGKALHSDFMSMLLAEADIGDIRYMAGKLGGDALSACFKKPEAAQPAIPTPIDRSVQSALPAETATSKAPQRAPAIQYWRSAEKNAAAWFEAQPGVVSVRDVSQANVGYDLQVTYGDGRQIQVEVKAVKRMGDPFRLTNNEHATAFQEGERYILAIVVNAEPFEICLISDPIRRLTLEKRCEQWSWYAEGYDTFLKS